MAEFGTNVLVYEVTEFESKGSQQYFFFEDGVKSQVQADQTAQSIW